jgi:hypothetical protein
MGTDIHGLVQQRRNGVWVDCPISAYDNRDYLVFAILANVRNGYGFAGCYRHEPIKPIQNGRGLPSDLELDATGSHIRSDDMWMGDHSYGWVSLREMLEYDWKQTIKQGGVLSLAEFVAWDKKSEPRSYCGGVSGQGVVTITPEEANNPAVLPQDHSKVYVQCYWEQPMVMACEHFMHWLNELNEYSFRNDINPDDIRFVFGFDS